MIYSRLSFFKQIRFQIFSLKIHIFNEFMKKEIFERIMKDLPPKLLEDIEKYGLENFKFEIIDSALTQEELDKKQKEYIKKLNTLEPEGYNNPDDC